MENDDLYRILEYSSAIVDFIPLLALTFSIRHITKETFPIASLVVLSLLTDTINFLLVSQNKNNFIVFRIYTYLEIFLISSFYFQFYKKYTKTNASFLIIPLFVAVSVVDYKINGINNFDNYETAFESIVFSIISLWTFYYISKQLLFDNLLNEPFFWLNTSILLYFGGNLILFIFNNYLLRSKTTDQLAMWCIHSVLNILYNLLIALGLWKVKRR